METIRYRPVKFFEDTVLRDLGYLDENTCKKLYMSGRIDDNWAIFVHIPDEETLIEKCSTLWTK